MPAGREAVATGGGDVAGRREPDHRRHPGGGHPGFHTVGSSQGEVDEVESVGGGDAAAGCLRGHGGLVGDLIEEESLDQLRLGDRRGDLEERLVGEHDPSFRNGPHVAAEPQAAERVDRIVVKAVAAQPFEVLIGEGE